MTETGAITDPRQDVVVAPDRLPEARLRAELVTALVAGNKGVVLVEYCGSGRDSSHHLLGVERFVLLNVFSREVQ